MNTNSNTVVNIWDVIPGWVTNSNSKKEPDTRRAVADVLAISHCLHRMYEDTELLHLRWQDLDDEKLGDSVTPEDHEAAAKIRKHFSSQILLSQLQDEHITEFQRIVAGIVEGPTNTYDNQKRGVYYRLPEYYYYDLSFSEMWDREFSDCNVRELIQPEHCFELTPVKRFTKRKRTEKVTEYWFKNNSTGEPVRLTVDLSNKLGYIVEHLFDKNKKFSVRGRFVTKTLRGLSFNTAHNNQWKINLDDVL